MLDKNLNITKLDQLSSNNTQHSVQITRPTILHLTLLDDFGTTGWPRLNRGLKIEKILLKWITLFNIHGQR